jgi:hypothetical protein
LICNVCCQASSDNSRNGRAVVIPAQQMIVDPACAFSDSVEGAVYFIFVGDTT